MHGVLIVESDYTYLKNVSAHDNQNGLFFLNSSFGEVYNSNFSYNLYEGMYINPNSNKMPKYAHVPGLLILYFNSKKNISLNIIRKI